MRIVAYARGGTRLAQHHRKLGFDVAAMKRERSCEARQVGIAERLAQESALGSVVGQLLRLVVAAPGSWTRRYPVGNTGGADVSALLVMPIPDDLRAVLDGPAAVTTK